MKTSSLAGLAALLSTSSAALVLLETTKCLDDSIPYGQRFDVEMNLSGPVAKTNLKSICGLRIVSATSPVDVNTIQCQAFKDVVGTQPGSAIFTYANPARIATNPREIKAVGCSYPVGGQKVRRQDNGTAIVSSTGTASSTVASSDAASSSGGPATITSTVTVGPSSGVPSSSANATTTTLSTTLTPSASQSTAPATSSGAAAGTVGLSMSVGLLAAFAAMFV